jgi:hypothetical protein
MLALKFLKFQLGLYYTTVCSGQWDPREGDPEKSKTTVEIHVFTVCCTMLALKSQNADFEQSHSVFVCGTGAD